jgi:hypothetical protein
LLALSIVIACLAGACARGEIDRIAEEYVALARAVERTETSLVERIAALHTRAVAVEERDDRRAFLLAQLAALERRARFRAGERTSIRDEAAALGIPVPAFNADGAARLRLALDRALGGTGPLAERLAQHQRGAALARAQLGEAVSRFVDECRSRTLIPRDVPDRGVEIRYAIDKRWPAFTTWAGDGRSLVEIRRDVAWPASALHVVVCHETYPGHHLQNLVWDDMRARRGWVEFSVVPPFTPHGAMAERLAIAGTTLALPRNRRDEVGRVLEDLAPLGLAIAVAIADGEVPRDEGLARLREEAVMPDASAFAAFVERERSMAVAYVVPVVGLRDWEHYLEILRSPALLAGADAATVAR